MDLSETIHSSISFRKPTPPQNDNFISKLARINNKLTINTVALSLARYIRARVTYTCFEVKGSGVRIQDSGVGLWVIGLLFEV